MAPLPDRMPELCGTGDFHALALVGWRLGAGCHLNRQTLESIEGAGFDEWG